MTQVEKHIDGLFSKIPNSKKARARKAELISECRDKFAALKKRKKSDAEASEAVISGIGTLDELREALPATGSLTNAIATVFFLLFAVACFFAAYFRITDESYTKLYTSFMEFFKTTFARPMRWGTGGFLILWTLARYSKIGSGIRLKQFPLRMLLLVLSTLFFVFYIFVLVCIWGSFLPSLTAALLPVCEFFWSGGQYLFAIVGATLFLGLRR